MPAVDQAPPTEAPKLVLHWRHRTTGLAGHGEPMPADVVRAHVEDANRRWPEIAHWSEEVPAPVSPTVVASPAKSRRKVRP